MSLFPDIPAGAMITEITPLPRDPNVRRVRVGRGASSRIVAKLRASEVERLELATGQKWTEQLAARVAQAVALEKARKDAFAALGRKGLSQYELIERLMRKGHEESIAQTVADECIADGWLDDAALERDVVQHSLDRKPAAERLLLEKLAQRGIPQDVAERIVREALGERNPVEEAAALAETKYRSMQSLPSPTAARRLAGFLHRRGFDDETVETVLNRMGLNDED
jgi:regulatory protein